MTMIETNLSDLEQIHDLITYPSIERQVMDLFRIHFPGISHKQAGGLTFDMDGSQCSVEVHKKKAKVSVIPPSKYDHDAPGIRLGECDYPAVSLPYNKDVAAKVAKFSDLVRKLKDLERRARELLPVAKDEVLEKFLNEELGSKALEVSFWNDNLFTGVEVVFYLHPKEQAPADGVLLCLHNDKIEPFWDGSTERRKLAFGRPQKVEAALGQNRDEDVPALKTRIAEAETIRARLDAFKPEKSPEFMHFLATKRQADELVKELHALLRK
jgi:hypothetical protein